jgi:hypothetical protein
VQKEVSGRRVPVRELVERRIHRWDD